MSGDVIALEAQQPFAPPCSGRSDVHGGTFSLGSVAAGPGPASGGGPGSVGTLNASERHWQHGTANLNQTAGPDGTGSRATEKAESKAADDSSPGRGAARGSGLADMLAAAEEGRTGLRRYAPAANKGVMRRQWQWLKPDLKSGSLARQRERPGSLRVSDSPDACPIIMILPAELDSSITW